MASAHSIIIHFDPAVVPPSADPPPYPPPPLSPHLTEVDPPPPPPSPPRPPRFIELTRSERASDESAVATHSIAITDEPVEQSLVSSRLTWRSIPVDVLHLIGLHLDGVSLAHLGRQDRLANAVVSQRRDLWLQALRHPILPPQFLGTICDRDREENPRLAFAHQHEAGVKKQRALACLVQQRVLVLLPERRTNEAKLRSGLAVVVLAPAFLFVLLLSAQLARGESVTYASLWPLLVIPSVLLVLATLVLGSNPLRQRRGSRYIHRGSSEPGLVLRTILDIRWSIDKLRAVTAFHPQCAWTITAAIFAFFLLLTLRVTSHATLSWTAVFIPLYVCFGLCCCAPYLSCLLPHWHLDEDELIEEDDETGMGAPIYLICTDVCILGPLLAFVILLHLYLLTAEYGLMQVMIPLFILDLWALFYALIATSAMSDYAPFRQWAWSLTFSLVVWTLTGGTLVVFKILLALKVDRNADLSYAFVFLPLYILQVTVLVGCLSLRRRLFGTCSEAAGRN